jgi:hypothetical protein
MSAEATQAHFGPTWDEARAAMPDGYAKVTWGVGESTHVTDDETYAEVARHVESEHSASYYGGLGHTAASAFGVRPAFDITPTRELSARVAAETLPKDQTGEDAAVSETRAALQRSFRQ